MVKCAICRRHIDLNNFQDYDVYVIQDLKDIEKTQSIYVCQDCAKVDNINVKQQILHIQNAANSSTKLFNLIERLKVDYAKANICDIFD